MEGAERTHQRHIIHFQTNRDYLTFARQMSRRDRSERRQYDIQPLRLIRAISCRLRTTGKLAAAPFVRSIEPDTHIHVHAPLALSPSGSASGTPRRKTAVIPWGIRHIRVPQAWPKTKGDRVRIGVIDTGADYSHPDLRHCLSRGVNIINRQLMPGDDNGHGTHIAGTIAAYARSRGVIGVAPQALIHPVKAFDHQGGAFVSDIISGIDWCVQNDVDIINMSFGMKSYSPALESAVLSAHHAGITIVASSGNEGRQAEVDYPARLKQVIAVGATNRKGRVAAFSNAGRQIDIYAPGENIYSTWLRGKYHKLSGTSMATSHVTGVIALMLALRPHMKPLRIKTLLRKHARLVLKRGQKAGGVKEIHALRAVSGAAHSS